MTDLFETGVIKLRGFSHSNKVTDFLDEFNELTQEHPHNPRKRAFGLAGIEIVRAFGDDTVRLADIQSTTPGEGTKAMNMICDLADLHDVTIELYAKGYSTTPTDKLVEWYGRFGFVIDDSRIQEDGVDMVRRPR